MLDDVLGSVRGLSDSTGMLSGTADYDVLGAVRQSSGSASIFGFTAEQRDAETGFTYLRARYLDPVVGRFGVVDSVIPNAAGTQGFNPYSYLAGNPTTWADPTGRSALPEYAETNDGKKIAGLFIAAAVITYILYEAIDIIVCALQPECWERKRLITSWPLVL